MAESPFLVSVKEHMLVRRYSRRTVESYLHWIKRYILFHGKTHPEILSAVHVESFLTHLVVNRQVSGGHWGQTTEKLADAVHSNGLSRA